MAGFYDTAVKRASPALLKQAAGVGRGDIIRGGVKTGTDFLGGREKRQYTEGVQDTLEGGDLTKLLALDQSKLTDDAAKDIQDRLPLLREQRLSAKFDMTKQDRDTYSKYAGILSGGAQNVATMPVTDTAMKKYGAIEFSPDETKLMEGTGEFGRIAPEDVESLKAKGATPEQLKSIMYKAGEQGKVGTIGGNLKPQLETRAELSTRAMAELKRQNPGVAISPALLKEHTGVLAADASARATGVKAQSAVVKQSGKNYDSAKEKYFKELAKLKKGGGKFFTKPDYRHKIGIDELKQKVSVGGAGFLPDAGKVEDADDAMERMGISEDERAFILARGVEPGFLGTSFTDSDGIATLVKEGRKAYKNRGYGLKSGSSQLLDTYKNRMNSAQASATSAGNKLKALGMTPQEGRNAQGEALLDRVGLRKQPSASMFPPIEDAPVQSAESEQKVDESGFYKLFNSPNTDFLGGGKEYSNAVNPPKTFESANKADLLRQAQVELREKQALEAKNKGTEAVPFKDRTLVEMLSSWVSGNPTRRDTNVGGVDLGTAIGGKKEEGLVHSNLDWVPAGVFAKPLKAEGSIAKIETEVLDKMLKGGKSVSAKSKAADEIGALLQKNIDSMGTNMLRNLLDAAKKVDVSYYKKILREMERAGRTL
jgi:hypothetical protein